MYVGTKVPYLMKYVSPHASPDRMPVPLGNFISKHAYNSKLISSHKITDSACIKFIDVRKGKEERVGSSWKVRTAD